MTISDPRTDLRFLLPLAAGERALLPACEATLVSALAANGLHVAGSSGLPWPVAAASADHVLLPALQGSLIDHIVEARRALRPGGYLLLGLVNSRSLYRWSSSGRRAGYEARDLRETRRLLERHDFHVQGCYGIRDSLARPALRVPLAATAPSIFYFRSRFFPATAGGALLGRLARRLIALGAQAWLYPALLFIARYQPPGYKLT